MDDKDERRPREEAPPDQLDSSASADWTDSTRPSAESKPAAQPFLELLFGNVGGYLEVRLIEEGGDRAVVLREWYPDPAALLADLERLLRIAAARNSAVFFGVLPRRSRGSGTAADALPGLVAWLDLDFRKLAGGEAEARERLTQFPLAPSIVVRSGHGLHAYWLVRERTASDLLSALSKRLARHLGGDHAFDAARVLRLPGTYNRKDPENPILVEIERLEAECTYNPSELEEALDLVGAPADDGGRQGSDGEPQPEIVIGERISDAVAALVQTEKRIGDLFCGRGKPGKSWDGNPLDTSASGYDFSLALELIKAGITDPSEIATAIWHRPGGEARAKGLAYVSRTVANALAQSSRNSAKKCEPAYQPNFKVERVRIFDSTPKVYELTIEGVRIRFKSHELRSRPVFTTKFMDALRRIPNLPTKIPAWYECVNGWLEGAEIVPMPPEASAGPALLEALRGWIDALPAGEEAEDLDQFKAVRLPNGKRVFKVESLLGKLREAFPDVTREQVCVALGDLKYVSRTRSIGGHKVRAWGAQRKRS